MRALIISTCLIFSILPQIQSQTAKQLYGNVFNEAGENLIGATVLWEGTDIGTVTDEKGDFWINKRPETANLIIQYVGYNPISVEMYPYEDTVFIKVEGITELGTVVVAEHRDDAFTSTLDTRNIEQITSCELKKAACCNLAESFETSGSVDVMRQDAVTSASEIQVLGLRGIYSQLLVEKRPAFTGLGSPLALEYIPGTWVGGIQVSKGTSTVQNGPQAMTGQINTELVKPFQDYKVFVNAFGATTGRGELNVHLNKRWNEQLSSGLLLHGSTVQGEFDKNKDGFIDQPKKTSLVALWRNFYQAENFSTQFNVQALSDERQSGQVTAFDNQPDAPNSAYRIDQKNQRVDVFGKFGYFGFLKPETSVGFIYGGSLHDMQNQFGNTRYNGQQRNFYANLLYASFIGTTDHRVNAGASFQYDNYDEFFNEADFSRTEVMPGVFGEYNFTREKFGVIAGLRFDHHNRYGLFATPRLNLKYNFNGNTILRLSGGRGVRTAQILSENIAVMASNRQFVVDQSQLEIEDAWNAGLNFTKNFKIGGKSASLVADLYRTQFVNQVVMDMESEQGKVLFYNLNGKSYSNSLLVLGSWAPLKGLDMKLVYKLNDVKVTYNPTTGGGSNDPIQRPLQARHRGLVTLNYETPNEKWMFNTNTQITGKQRFAHSHGVPSELIKDFTGNSPAYVIVNAQVTRRFKTLEFYLGGENLTNFTQKSAIVDWQKPFGEYFDAMQVWGPLVGARAYFGIRWWID
ncbi:MAG: TonB-dependent receptor [Saprospiraceae bacterium]|nr:TonB-dependent receptor [Saprospiraceae bacterium]MCF8252451.1 TonB-dependent receptor [Saprospiraceae bacterium]MCF8282318.1 TonB-dependent receptor [Bacteroidales bacterium]MCF8314062.1 TonB-dependent receptor [Saprospiraceae bacterium]MCF8442800.1 TonB-dependent receptor [Saprospiraceae bacterium]